MRITLVFALLSLTLSFGSCAQPFTKGNLLALKKNVSPISQGSPCVAGGFVEFTPSGHFVQEVMFPTDIQTKFCPLFAGDYNSRSTIATDGYRAIIPCCMPWGQSSLVSFAIVHGDGSYEVTWHSTSSNNHIPINAVMNDTDIWYQADGSIYYVNVEQMPNSTRIYSGSLFALQIHEGNLFVSNYDTLPCSIAQIGNGLPKYPTEVRQDFLERTDINYFTFVNDYLVLARYPDGFNIYNFTSQQLVLSSGSTDTREIVQFVPLFDQGKVIAHLASPIPGLYSPGIYSFPWNETTGIGSFETATLLLNSTAGSYYYSPTVVPATICTDGIKNYAETDVDCGGSLCAKCGGGKHCLTNNDCTSGECNNYVCEYPLICVCHREEPGTPAVAAASSGTSK